MTLLLILFLILIGILLLFLELAVLPGITIAGIGGIILLAASVYFAFANYGTGIGILTLLIIFALVPSLLFRFFKGKTGKKMMLQSEITGKIEGLDHLNIHPGDEGVTVGRLVPGGKVKLNNHIIEGKSATGFIDPGEQIRVVEVLKTRVIVEPINN